MAEEKVKKFVESYVWYGKFATREEDKPHEEGDFYVIKGKASAIGEKDTIGYLDGEPINEMIDHGAFDKTDFTDVVLNINHGDGNYAVARTRNKTLDIDLQNDGVYITARLKKENQRCQQFYEDVKEGLLDKMSFAFRPDINSIRYDMEEDCFHIGKIDVVHDVSAVEFPAYKNTSIDARSEVAVALSDKKAVALESIKKRQETMERLERLCGGTDGESVK